MRRSPGETCPEDIGTRNNLLCVLSRGRRQFRVRSDVRVRLTLGLEAPNSIRPRPGTPRPVAYRRPRPFSWFQGAAAKRGMTTDTVALTWFSLGKRGHSECPPFSSERSVSLFIGSLVGR